MKGKKKWTLYGEPRRVPAFMAGPLPETEELGLIGCPGHEPGARIITV